MARAKSPSDNAAQTTAPPAVIQPIPDPFANVPKWQYVGPGERVYVDVPVTVQPGDIIPRATIPANDGNWEPTDQAPNKHADNYQANEGGLPW